MKIAGTCMIKCALLLSVFLLLFVMLAVVLLPLCYPLGCEANTLSLKLWPGDMACSQVGVS